jgi:hypothetical protein
VFSCAFNDYLVVNWHNCRILPNKYRKILAIAGQIESRYPEIMPELTVSPPEEVFEPNHAAHEKVEADEYEYMLAEVGDLASHWESAIDDITSRSGDWASARQEIYNNYLIQNELCARYDDTPVVQRAYEKVNFLFGTMPGNYIDSQANIILATDKIGQYSPSKIEAMQAGNQEMNFDESLVNRTEWHNEAIWSLLRFRNSELTEAESVKVGLDKTETTRPPRSFPEILIPTMAKLFHRALPPGIAASELGASLSGLYGPVRLARTARRAGHQVYLPPTPWDVYGKVDLLLADEESKIIAPTQIKSTTKLGSARVLLPEAPTLEFGGPEMAPSKDWLALSAFCQRIAQNPEWQAKGFQIRPKWANIYDARTDIEGFTSLVSSRPDPRDVSMIRI